jgi:hypothetical protein
MSERISLRRLHLRNAVLLLSVPVLAGCQGMIWRQDVTVREEVKQVFQTSPAPRIVVHSFNGEISATAAADGQASIEVTKFASGASEDAAARNLKLVEVTMEQQEDTIHVAVKRTGDPRGTSLGADVYLAIPANCQLTLQTSNGNLSSHHISGGQSLHTSNGSITVTEGRGEMDVTTSNGAVTLAADSATVRARTSNGEIVFNGSLAKGSHSLETSNGAVSIALPADAQFHIDATTRVGSVRTDFPLTKIEEKDRCTLRGSVGDSAEVSITALTSNGRIAILRR